jgi:hypothetical protein
VVLERGVLAATHKPLALASALRIVVDKGGLAAHPAAVPSELERLPRGPAAAVGDGGADAHELHGFLDEVESLQRLAFVSYMALTKLARQRDESPSAGPSLSESCIAGIVQAQPFFASEQMLAVWCGGGGPPPPPRRGAPPPPPRPRPPPPAGAGASPATLTRELAAG